MEGPRLVLLILIFIFIFLTPETQPPSLSQRRQFENRLSTEQQALDLLRASHYNDFDFTLGRFVGVTGLRSEDGYAWDLLSVAKEKARGQTTSALGQDAASKLELDFNDVSGEAVNQTLSTPIAPLYRNVSSVLRGQWTRSKVADGPSKLNLTSLVPDRSYISHNFNRNITDDNGKLMIVLNEKKSQALDTSFGRVREISAEIALKAPISSPGNGWEFTLHGVHIPDAGQTILTTSSEKFAGIFALPHFAPSRRSFELSRQLLNQTLSEAILKQNSSQALYPVFPWSSSNDSPGESLFPTPSCEYIIYLQQHPVWFPPEQRAYSTDPVSVLKSIENELRTPEGAPVPRAPPVTMSAVIYSPDCGFILETKGPPAYSPEDGLHLVGPKLESYISLVKYNVLGLAVVLAGQIALLFRQMQDASTPSTRSRVSFSTMGMMCLGDGFFGLALLACALFVDTNILPLLSATFFALLGVSLLGMRFLADIWAVQAPERIERERQQNANRDINAPPPPPPAPPDTLPPPVTAPRPTDTGATPVILPPDQDLSAAQAEDATTTQTRIQRTPGGEFGATYSKFYFLLLGISFSSLWVYHWPTFLRSAYVNTLTILYLSFWCPQIYRNIMRNCRKALRWEFVVGQSILRLAPFAYFYLVPNNILLVENDSTAFLVIAGWVWLQCWALFSQDLLGPRFFIPKGWAPPAYDYHPILREDDIEAGSMPMGSMILDDKDSLSRTTSRVENSKRSYDCAICMQNIEVPIIPSAESNLEGPASLATNILSRRTYMVTPCKHIFHSPCLEGWMKFRLQCPICREPLPPL